MRSCRRSACSITMPKIPLRVHQPCINDKIHKYDDDYGYYMFCNALQVQFISKAYKLPNANINRFKNVSIFPFKDSTY
jgi:hypothetical protein